MELAQVPRLAQELARNLEQVMVGKPREIELLLVGLLCQGHVLIEDVPDQQTHPSQTRRQVEHPSISRRFLVGSRDGRLPDRGRLG